MNVVARALRPMGLADLKVVEANLEIKIATLPVPQRKVIRTLFYDVVAMIGTNPAIMLVKERLLDTTKYVFKSNPCFISKCRILGKLITEMFPS